MDKGTSNGQESPAGVVVADNDTSVRAALCKLLDCDPRLQLLGEASDGWEAADLCAKVKPRVAVIDVRMPHGGVEATVSIHAVSPATRVVVFTIMSDRRTRARLLRAGVVAVYSKTGGVNMVDEIARIVGAPRPS